MIWGNHDSFSIKDLFSGYYDILNVTVNNQRITLCHYAMAVWDKSHRGAWQLYGHSHTNLEGWIDKAMPGHFSMDVGIDNAARLLGEYRPFSFEEISSILMKRKGFFPDHHGRNRNLISGPTEEEIIEKN
jgi:calcineurin-like phosphoesterase family protein